MNYKKIYDSLCTKKRDRRGCYVEDHHIIPRCMGGSNNKKNIVSLSYREHFLAHWLLCKIYSRHSGIHYAFSCMLRKQPTGERILTSRMYETIKRDFSNFKRWHINISGNPGKTEKSRKAARKRMLENNPITMNPEKNHTAQPIRVHFLDGSCSDYSYAKKFCIENSIPYDTMKYWLSHGVGSKKYNIEKIERL